MLHLSVSRLDKRRSAAERAFLSPRKMQPRQSFPARPSEAREWQWKSEAATQSRRSWSCKNFEVAIDNSMKKLCAEQSQFSEERRCQMIDGLPLF